VGHFDKKKMNIRKKYEYIRMKNFKTIFLKIKFYFIRYST
jgi:hypothetical protein